jgi:hypothetical protein
MFKDTESEIIYLHRQTLHDGRLYEVGGRVVWVKKWHVCLDCSETSTWNHMKISRKEVSKCQLHVPNHRIYHHIRAPSKFAWHTNVKTFAWHTNQKHQFGNTWKWAESSFFFLEWAQASAGYMLRNSWPKIIFEHLEYHYIGVTPSSKGRVEGGEGLK